ncbi:transglutaminase family protein [Aquabacterium sp. CECT 9606]|uniref:transglutaminase-like domain-containing protein n=1 Tax=Aquabacterium sp. CECT 9606 TaxID=2845822 RepID=UPI001E53928A|nr:transglutaminase family protein [Aquabacterium sp. CECT 9606]CAH0353227.1 hypothetical protein AQB9606_03125 [Aquabacterium sp. CECT 9606]
MNEHPNLGTLAPTPLIDSDHPDVLAFAERHAKGANDRERAIALYYAVRDGFKYDPYRIDLSSDGMRASRVIKLGVGWCVTKATLLAAASRAARIPARLGYSDVRNHLSTERMRQTMKTDLFVWHGYAEIWLEGAWVKTTPAFNIELCERFGLLPLDWDGHADSLYHPFDREGNRHMEYVRQHGSFDDVPLAEISAAITSTYPDLHALSVPETSFEADVLREQSR